MPCTGTASIAPYPVVWTCPNAGVADWLPPKRLGLWPNTEGLPEVGPTPNAVFWPKSDEPVVPLVVVAII